MTTAEKARLIVDNKGNLDPTDDVVVDASQDYTISYFDNTNLSVDLFYCDIVQLNAANIGTDRTIGTGGHYCECDGNAGGGVESFILTKEE